MCVKSKQDDNKIKLGISESEINMIFIRIMNFHKLMNMNFINIIDNTNFKNVYIKY